MKAIMIMLIVSVFFISVAYGKENGIMMGFQNVIENLVTHAFLEHRGILGEDTIGEKAVESLFIAVQNQDIEAVKAMFAPAAIVEIDKDEFEKQVAAFVEYCDGELVSVQALANGTQTAESHHAGKNSKEIRGPYTVITSTNEYRLAIKYVSCDDWNSDNIGIWSLYIIEGSKDTYPDNGDNHTYLGDGKYSTGIFFDVPRTSP